MISWYLASISYSFVGGLLGFLFAILVLFSIYKIQWFESLYTQ